MASVQSHSTERRNSGRPRTQRVRKLVLEGKALGCFREGTMRLCWALFRFCNQNFIGEFFLLHKIWAHPWKCPECEGMPQHLQRPSVCIYVHWKGEAPHRGKQRHILGVGMQMQWAARQWLPGVPPSSATHSAPGSAPATAHTYLT